MPTNIVIRSANKRDVRVGSQVAPADGTPITVDTDDAIVRRHLDDQRGEWFQLDQYASGANDFSASGAVQYDTLAFNGSQFVPVNDVQVTGSGGVHAEPDAVSTPAFETKPKLEPGVMFEIRGNGQMAWSDGTNPIDTTITRAGAGVLSLANGNELRVSTQAGNPRSAVNVQYLESVIAASGGASDAPDYTATGMGGVDVALTTAPYPAMAEGAGMPLLDGVLYCFAMWVSSGTTISEVHYNLQTNGNFTADNNNRIGLYTATDANTLTLQASTADDPNIWQAGVGWQSKPLSSPIAVTGNRWIWMAFLRNSSASVTNPIVRELNPDWIGNFGATGSPLVGSPRRYTPLETGQADLPATIDLTVGGSTGNIPWIVLEK